MKTLELWTPAEINDEAARLHRLYGEKGGRAEYDLWIGKLRRECFERMAAAMDPAGELADWEGQMIAKHGPKVQVHAGVYGWKAALGIARYGEAPDFWPETFGADDVIRAKRWLYEGNAPEGITYITMEG